MSPDNPKVRDFTTQTQSVPVVVEVSPVYELLLSLFVWGNRSSCDEYECGSAFFEQVKAETPDAIAEQMEVLADCGELWLPLLGVAHDSGRLGSVEEFSEYVNAMDPEELRKYLMHSSCLKGDIGKADIDAAANGDPAALAKISEHADVSAGFISLLTDDAAKSQQKIVETLAGVQAILGSSISDLLPALQRDADEKRTLGRSMDAPAFVEAATNGVTFKMQPQITGVLLIPSKIVRPWTVIASYEGTQVFAYSVADENLTADADAPPTYLVDLYKALGDERRLRILAILSEGDAGLMEIAERVELAKSTAHHHLRILRSAGLVRAIVGDNKAYSLRRNQLPEVGRMLNAFLTPPQAPETTHTRETEGD